MEHYNFKLRNSILFAIDYKCISILNKDTGYHLTLNYPEAAVWAVLIENHKKIQTTLMLMSVLGKSKSDTISYIGECLIRWKDNQIIE
jgi:hypothetical protein